MLGTPVPFASPIAHLLPAAAIGRVPATAEDFETRPPDSLLLKGAPEPGPAAALLQRGQLWAALRVVEAAFPCDGFAEAAAFDEARLGGRVRDADEVSSFVEEALWEVGSFNVPFVRATRAEPSLHAATDAVCDALMPNPIARRASRTSGRSFLSGTGVLSPATSRLATDATRDRVAGHLAPAFGAVLGLLGAGDEDACRLFLYLGARGIFSAAVRLGLVGPLECYARIAAAMPTVNAILLEHPDDDRADVAALAISPATCALSGAAPDGPPSADAR